MEDRVTDVDEVECVHICPPSHYTTASCWSFIVRVVSVDRFGSSLVVDMIWLRGIGKEVQHGHNGHLDTQEAVRQAGGIRLIANRIRCLHNLPTSREQVQQRLWFPAVSVRHTKTEFGIF